MFRKPFHTKSNTLLKNSERKKLLHQLQNTFHVLSSMNDDEDALTTSLCMGKGSVSLTKLVTHSGVVLDVYMCEGLPMFFHGRGNRLPSLTPTLYALHRVPDLISSITTWSVVLSKINGGADLMLPGVGGREDGMTRALGDNYNVGELVAIRIHGNSIVRAIGETGISGESVRKYGCHGKAAVVSHTLGDFLWTMGNKDIVAVDEVRLEDELWLSNIGQSEHEHDAAVARQEDQDTTNVGGSSEDGENTLHPLEDDVVTSGLPKDMTELVDYCFLWALRNTKDSDLPLLASTFYAVNILANRPVSADINIKSSKYKKVGQLLKEKADSGILTIETDQRAGTTTITAINRNHDDIYFFKKLHDGSSLPENAETTPEFGGLCITEFFQAPPKLWPVFAYVKDDSIPEYKAKECLWSLTECRNALNVYIKKEDLALKGSVTVDPILRDALWKKTDYSGGPSITRKNLDKLFVSALTPYYSIEKPGEITVTKRGLCEPVTVSFQCRNSKKVTSIVGLERFFVDPSWFAQHMQVKAACSCSVAPCGSKVKAQVVLIQSQRIKDILAELSLLIPRQYILDTTNKLKTKK